MSQSIRELVALGSRVLDAAGHGDLIWGHVSARDPNGRGAWLKQSGWGMGEITAPRVHLVDPDGTILEGEGSRHKEFPIHTEILLARPDVGGVAHTHSRAAVALAAAGQELLPVSHEANFFVPPQVPTFTLTGDLVISRDLGRAVASELGESNAMFLRNHGTVCVGPDLQSAVVAAILLDRACSQQLLTLQAGSHLHRSGEQESLRKRHNIYGGESIHQVWDYLVRRLAASNGGPSND